MNRDGLWARKGRDCCSLRLRQETLADGGEGSHWLQAPELQLLLRFIPHQNLGCGNTRLQARLAQQGGVQLPRNPEGTDGSCRDSGQGVLLGQQKLLHLPFRGPGEEYQLPRQLLIREDACRNQGSGTLCSAEAGREAEGFQASLMSW